MSSSAVNNDYAYYIEVDAGTTSLLANFFLYTGQTANDALALELANAIKSVDWPAGATVSVQLSKSVVDETDYTAGGSPLAFS